MSPCLRFCYQFCSSIKSTSSSQMAIIRSFRSSGCVNCKNEKKQQQESSEASTTTTSSSSSSMATKLRQKVELKVPEPAAAPAPPAAPAVIEKEERWDVYRIKEKMVENPEVEVKKEDNYLRRYAEIPRENTKPGDIVAADIRWFRDDNKEKEVFLDKVEQFSREMTTRRHHQVEFIYAALRIMKDYGVHKDLQAYKALMDIFPKGPMVPTNRFQVMFFHFFKQQECAVQLLHTMELAGVEPDSEMEQLVIDIFGQHSLVWRKVARQLYWFSKLRNANPYPLPEGDISHCEAIDLARMALKRMCPDIQTKINTYSGAQVIGSIDKTWIVSAQSASQRELIEQIAPDQPLYVEGPFRVWLKDQVIMFFQLRADNRLAGNSDPLEDPKLKDEFDVTKIPITLYGSSSAPDVLMTQKGIHQQEDGTILAIGATGTSSRDSLLSWIRILQSVNPKLKHLTIIFSLKAAPASGLQASATSHTSSSDTTATTAGVNEEKRHEDQDQRENL